MITKKQKKTIIRIIITSVMLLSLHFFEDLNENILLVLYLIPYLIIGYDILLHAIKGIKNKQVFDENFLMVVATIGAIGLKDYHEAVVVMLFYQIGELFQSIAIRKSRKNISELMNIRPDYANLEVNGEFRKVSPDEVKIDDLILIKVGEKVPLDGMVIKGESSLNTSALTGESVPRSVKVNDEIISGSINMEAPLTIKVTKLFEESTVSKILNLVENATSNKSKSENFISKFARIYTPVVVYLAIGLMILPPLFIHFILNGELDFSKWIYRAFTFLVISCPCALVISIPLSFFGGIGGASSQGILIKGSNYLEKLSKISSLALDKTGTITKGVFEVTTIHNSNYSKEELLEYASLAECYSSHPIGKSIIKEYKKPIDEKRVNSIKEMAGLGIKAIIDNKEVLLGNEKLMEQNNIKVVPCNDEGTIVHLAIGNEYKGHIHIGDVIKPTSIKAIEELKKLKLKEIIMLTGDDKNVAEEISRKLNINKTYSNLLPQDKVNILKEMIDKKETKDVVGFVGDGINDAPVLALADVGIAMGALGSDAAIEAADIVLMDDDPLKISKAIKISKKCMHIVYENIYFAIGIKILCLILGAFGIANMWLAIFADVGVMVIAVINSIRSLYVKKL